MLHAPVLPDSIAGGADVLPARFSRSWAGGGPDGIRARQVARRLLVLRGPPNVDRVLTLAGHRDDVDIHELDPVDPPVQLLLRLDEAELAS